jgi:GxxExxY protein
MNSFIPLPVETEKIVTAIMDAAFKVHRTLGPGLLESVYEACLVRELELRAVKLERQVAVPVDYEGMKLDAGLRLDLLVADQVVVELKAVDKMNPIFEAQLLTYLKLAGKRIGLLVNFNVAKLKDGFKRMVI